MGNLFELHEKKKDGGAENAKTLFLVDATSLLYRSFYAVRNLSTRDGRPTNAIFGTLKMAQKLLCDHRPEYVAFVFDLPAPTFRHEAFEAYKANRPETPRDLQAQIPPAKEILRAMGLPVLELSGYEADDIIGTLVQKASAAGMESVIVTADKDLFQLVRPGVRVLHTKKEDALLDARGVEDVFGVPPERVVDVLALWGDPTDNIPGVPGIGEKGAKELVKQYGSLEEVLAHAADISRKAYREGLLQGADQARFSRQLATVCTDAPVPWEVPALRPGEPDREKLAGFYRDFEFTSLLQEVGETPATDEVRAEARDLDAAALERLLAASSVGFAWEDETLWLSDGEAAWCGPRLFLAPEPFGRLPLCAHNLKPFLRAAGAAEYRPAPAFLDAAVAGYMLDPSARVPTLAALADRFLNARSVQGDKASEAILLARLAVPLRGHLASLGMAGLWAAVEGPLVSTLARMETVGIGVDVAYFRDLGSSMGESLARLEKEIQAAAGVEFNPASPKQVGEVLFDKLMLPVQKKTSKTKSYSTDSEVLETLREAHPVVPLLLEHRMLAKLKGTYADPLPSYADSAGRLHASFHQAATATGRLSSSDPNLQNIPIRGDWGPKIRRGFLAGEGFLLCGADYSQIELRMLAHLCGDAALKGIFERGEDIHRATAAEVFGVMPGLVTGDMRRQAKAVNFGILYGMGPFGLARELGVPQREAKAFIDRYFQRFPSVRAYLDGVEKEALDKEQVSTILGRRRLFPGIARAPKPLQAALLRQAVNTTVQGSAADLIKKAMVEVEPELPTGAHLVLQVHDELIVEAPADLAPKAGKVLQSAMEGALHLDVPLVAGVSTGRRWDELK